MSERLKPEFMNLSDTATLLSMSRRTLERWVSDGKIAVVRINSAVRVPMAEIERLINQDAMPKVE
jgi:excisionase family DNA binding protein